MASQITVPLIIRGRLIEDTDLEFGGRHGGSRFKTADVSKYADQLTLSAPSQMADLYALTFEEIADYLVELGQRLSFDKNIYMQQAFELACTTSGLSESILRNLFVQTPQLFNRQEIYDSAERSCGLDYLNGWVEQPTSSVPGSKAYVRAFGARCVHVIAGNVPSVSALTLIRNAFTRSDCIVKTPSNDPLTAAALARTMMELDADHPLTKHFSVAYWKGGDEAIESTIFDPRKIEKIIAWGGFNSVKHITKYLQPGIDLITLDPKLSGTIIGKEAFSNDSTLLSVATRLALDIGALNQEACTTARVIYVESGTNAEGLALCTKLGALTFEALQNLPNTISTPHRDFNPELKDEINAAKMLDDDYTVFGGLENEGAVIVSLEDYPVDFSRILGCRVGNLVPIDNLDTAVKSVNAYTQTIGIYPESLKTQLRDQLSFQGAQRIVSLGGAISLMQATNTQLQDGIEPVRRMCKWITDEVGDSDWLESLAVTDSSQLLSN